MHITLDMLERLAACSQQRSLFNRLFPNGTDVTVELCEQHSDRFDWQWAAENFLTEESALVEYDNLTDAALTEYGNVSSAAQEKYIESTATATAEYDAVVGAARTEYYKVPHRTSWPTYDKALEVAHQKHRLAVAPAKAEYDNVCVAAQAVYYKVCAAAWAKAFLSQHER